MGINRLIGADATLEKAAFGSTLTSGTATKGTWYKIVLKTGDTVFPAGYLAGDLIQGDGAMTFSATNSAQPVTFTTMEDCSSWSVEFTKDEIEVTVLSDKVKKYRAGKADASGSIEGINFVSELKKAGGVANKFLRVVKGDKLVNSASSMSAVDNSEFYFRGLLQDYDALGETVVFLFGKIELYGWTAGAAVGDAQSWTSNFRFIDNDPILYCIDNLAAPTT
jgi:hypothetical protein